MSSNCSDEEVKADIMNRLMRRGCWGGKYLPLENLVRWVSKNIKRNGKRIRRLIRELIKEGYLLSHKKGKAISLNPSLSREIAEYIEEVLGI